MAAHALLHSAAAISERNHNDRHVDETIGQMHTMSQASNDQHLCHQPALTRAVEACTDSVETPGGSSDAYFGASSAQGDLVRPAVHWAREARLCDERA